MDVSDNFYNDNCCSFYDYNDQENSLEETQTIETPQPSDNNFLVNEIINVDNPEEATNDTEFNSINNEKNGKKFADIWNYISYNNSEKRVCKKCSYVFLINLAIHLLNGTWSIYTILK